MFWSDARAREDEHGCLYVDEVSITTAFPPRRVNYGGADDRGVDHLHPRRHCLSGLYLTSADEPAGRCQGGVDGRGADAGAVLYVDYQLLRRVLRGRRA